LEKARRQIKLDGLASALNPDGTNPSLSSKLVHINASADFSSMGEKSFASPEIRDRLLKMLVSDTAFTEEIWIKATSDIGNAGGRAHRFEQLWHYWAQRGSRDVTIKYVAGGCDKQGQRSDKMKKTKPWDTCLCFENKQNTLRIRNLKDLVEFVEGQYVKPYVVNFSATDSFAFFNKEKLWKAKLGVSTKHDVTLVLWQMTITKDNIHSAQAPVLASILEKCAELLQKKFNVVFLYAVEDISGFEFQPYVTGKRAQYKQMPKDLQAQLGAVHQYAIKFKN